MRQLVAIGGITLGLMATPPELCSKVVYEG